MLVPAKEEILTRSNNLKKTAVVFFDIIQWKSREDQLIVLQGSERHLLN